MVRKNFIFRENPRKDQSNSLDFGFLSKYFNINEKKDIPKDSWAFYFIYKFTFPLISEIVHFREKSVKFKGDFQYKNFSRRNYQNNFFF